MDNYRYRMLAKGEIRTLSLEPAEFDDPIHVSIQPTQLLSDPLKQNDQSFVAAKYEAVSYAWGSSYLSQSIIVNNKHRLSVTDSCFQALKHFRFLGATRTLWIDAICIDQKNLAEKSVQVGMMGQIYQNANDVLVWLGPSDGQVYLAFAMLKAVAYRTGDLSSEEQVATVLYEAQDTDDWEGWDTYKDLTDPNGDFHCPCCPRTGKFETAREAYEMAAAAIDQLAHRDWFCRLWVAQEVALARDSLWMYCGHHIATFSIMSNFTGYVNYGEGLSGEPRSWFMANCRGSALTNMQSITNIRDHVVQKDTDFVRILFQSWHMACKDPLDRIYAIRSITDIAQWAAVTVDYSMERSVLYSQIVSESIEHTKEPGHFASPPAILLTIASLSRSLTDHAWPSWIPDFDALCLAGTTFGTLKAIAEESSISGSSGCTMVRDAGERCKVGREVEHNEFNAWSSRCSSFLRSGGLTAQLATTRERSPCKGYQNGRLTDLENTHCGFDQLSTVTRQDTKLCENHEHRALAVLLALSCDTDESRAFLLNWLQKAGGPLSNMDPDCVLAAIDVQGAMFFGWVPPATKHGDRMCFLLGAPFPFVVREAPRRETYTLIGDALLPGIREIDTGWDDEVEQFITLC
ncbi:hypothetical protein PRZ48_012687 [Zasmidium cellare]|uniref:Heterokaryon incompatibility domain-containing protein n=1 Tax=Zasmidium cellare TaxID=395010 RepID=A0ABR0E5K8_ZASCE|nr:hypothetical protein PRZ48_012687 [Zasmidium cellare]